MLANRRPRSGPTQRAARRSPAAGPRSPACAAASLEARAPRSGRVKLVRERLESRSGATGEQSKTLFPRLAASALTDARFDARLTRAARTSTPPEERPRAGIRRSRRRPKVRQAPADDAKASRPTEYARGAAKTWPRRRRERARHCRAAARARMSSPRVDAAANRFVGRHDSCHTRTVDRRRRCPTATTTPARNDERVGRPARSSRPPVWTFRGDESRRRRGRDATSRNAGRETVRPRPPRRLKRETTGPLRRPQPGLRRRHARDAQGPGRSP